MDIAKKISLSDLDERYRQVVDQQTFLEAINSGQKLVFVTHYLSDTMEMQLDFAIAALLKKYQHEHLQSVLYSCLKEIVVNATRANAKEAYFRKQNLDMNDPGDLRRGMNEIKGNLSEEWILKYGKLAREYGLDVSVHMYHEDAGIKIEVLNAPMKAEDETRIRAKLRAGMAYDDLMAFYMEHGDQTEGEGMGLVMILLLLKAEKIDPNLFRIGVVDGETLSRLEIPFSSDFISERGDNPRGH